jgi:hypothetical protein
MVLSGMVKRVDTIFSLMMLKKGGIEQLLRMG